MAGQNRIGAVDLLGHHQPREGVSQRHRPQREQQLRPRPCRLRPAVGRPDGEDNLLRPLVPPRAQPRGKGFRAHLPPAAVQQHGHGGRAPLLPFQPIQQRLLGAEGLRLAARKAQAAPQINRGQGVEFVFRARARADMRQSKVHGREHILERFSNTYVLTDSIEGGFFLRKTPLCGVVSVYSNWRTAITAPRRVHCGRFRWARSLCCKGVGVPSGLSQK